MLEEPAPASHMGRCSADRDTVIRHPSHEPVRQGWVPDAEPQSSPPKRVRHATPRCSPRLSRVKAATALSDGRGRPLVLASGDSLIAGYGLAPADAFPAQLETLLRRRHPGARVLNAGVSGETSAGGRARLPRVLSRLDARPDLVILELGANDFLRGIGPAATRANLGWMLDELARCDVPVLLAGMRAPDVLGEPARRFNALFPNLAAAHRCAFYPFFLDGVAGVRGLTLADRIHPNARAVALVAARVLPHVEAALDRRPLAA